MGLDDFVRCVNHSVDAGPGSTDYIPVLQQSSSAIAIDKTKLGIWAEHLLCLATLDRRAPDGLGISTPATHYYYSTKPTVLVYDWRRQARGHAEEGTRERVGGQSLETR